MNILALVNAYNARHGLGRIKPVDSVQLDERIMMGIADAYDNLKHDPKNPTVAQSYHAFKTELLAQWNFAKANGIVFELTDTDPYPDSQSMIRDVTENNRLRIYRGGSLQGDHPLAETALPGTVYNVIFRGVHDLFGHAAHNNSFGPTGELRAFLAHSQSFSHTALGALAAETLAQNSWVNFGKHLRVNGRIPKKGEAGYIEPRNRPYALQKATIYNTNLPSQLLKCEVCGGPSDHMHGKHGCCGKQGCHMKLYAEHWTYGERNVHRSMERNWPSLRGLSR